jgi:hypothetical protein
VEFDQEFGQIFIKILLTITWPIWYKWARKIVEFCGLFAFDCGKVVSCGRPVGGLPKTKYFLFLGVRSRLCAKS